MKRFIYIICIVVIAIQIGCQKESLLTFQLTDKVYIYKNSRDQNRDSITYSFAVRPLGTATDTVRIPVRIIGKTVDRDRLVQYRIIDSLSDVSVENYEMLPASIAANSFIGQIPICVKKTAPLADREMRLWIEIVASDDLQPGVHNQLQYLIKLNDFLSRPASWNEGRFGRYSQAKYGLIIRETGYVEFTGLSVYELQYIVQACKNVIWEYEAENGVWYDEFDEPLRFP